MSSFLDKTGLTYLWSKIKSAFVTALGTSGNYLTWTKNGTTNNITIPYATKASQDASGNAISYTYATKLELTTGLGEKQSTLTFDSTPTSESSNPVTSDGINTALVGKADANATTSGTYKSVTVNTQGIVTSGTNPVTLAGYGIVDASISNGTITLGNSTITPLTSYTETDPVFAASAAHGITSSDITKWNSSPVLGDDDGTVTEASFSGYADTVWNKTQTLSSAQQLQARTNISAVGSSSVTAIVSISQSDYDALATKDSTTLYVITS